LSTLIIFLTTLTPKSAFCATIGLKTQVCNRGVGRFLLPELQELSVTFGEPLRFTVEGPDEIVEKARQAVLELGAV
jgi:hypothetical protein